MAVNIAKLETGEDGFSELRSVAFLRAAISCQTPRGKCLERLVSLIDAK